MNALEAAKVAEAALEDKLGEDIKVLDLRGLSNIADCFVIAAKTRTSCMRWRMKWSRSCFSRA